MPVLPLVGEEFAGYRLRAVIARGGMSVVFQAENPRLGNIVAVKVLAPELATNDVFRARFLQESRIAASMSHPHVIPIYDVGPYNELLYIAMRYVAGRDLRALLKKEHQISAAHALDIVGQVARALDAAHRQGLVHRDVKPGNILLEQEADDGVHVYLADFGITKHALSRSGLTSTGEFVGTIDYVAPEQIQGTSVDGRADQYSLGCVLYECLTGRAPFEKDLDAAVIWAHVEEPPPMPTTRRPELPSRIDDVFARVMAKKAADRYPTCREFADAARAALADYAPAPPTVAAPRPAESDRETRQRPPADPGRHGQVAQPNGAISRPQTSQRRRRWAAVLGALAVLIAAGAGSWLALRGSSGPSHAGAMPSHAAAMPSKHASASPMNPLMHLLAETNNNGDAKGVLPPSTCHTQSMTQVTCMDPSPGIMSVTFQTYPSLRALYKAYVARVKSFNSGHFEADYSNCSNVKSNGELTWNHNFEHRLIYSLKQSMSGTLNKVTQAAGRVFCNITNLYDLVWTQDDRHILAWLNATDHEGGYHWWVKIHHNIEPGPGTHM